MIEIKRRPDGEWEAVEGQVQRPGRGECFVILPVTDVIRDMIRFAKDREVQVRIDGVEAKRAIAAGPRSDNTVKLTVIP